MSADAITFDWAPVKAAEKRPTNIKEANRFVREHHRHSDPVIGAKFALGVECGTQLVGVALVGRPVARMLQDGRTAEVLRVCTSPGCPKNICSLLYGSARRIWLEMGGHRIVTYLLKSETGTSLRAVGWRPVAAVKAAEWSRPSRGRRSQSVYAQEKVRWEAYK